MRQRVPARARQRASTKQPESISISISGQPPIHETHRLAAPQLVELCKPAGAEHGAPGACAVNQLARVDLLVQVVLLLQMRAAEPAPTISEAGRSQTPVQGRARGWRRRLAAGGRRRRRRQCARVGAVPAPSRHQSLGRRPANDWACADSPQRAPPPLSPTCLPSPRWRPEALPGVLALAHCDWSVRWWGAGLRQAPQAGAS